MEYKDCLQQIQGYLENSPLIVLGSGASAPYGLPLMSDLKAEILKCHNKFNQNEFESLCVNLEGMGLEEALNGANLSDATRETVRNIVWNCINESDMRFFGQLISDKNNFALSDLLKKIIQPAHNAAVVVTTNYDRIAEYAADIIGATIITGFEGNFLKVFEFPTNTFQNKRVRARERTVSIWKVHGSLDWFNDPNGNNVGYPLLTAIPSNHTPLIIPPGKDKYNATHGEPYRDVIAQADKAFSNAGSYLCVGYGFNDEHIQPKLIEQIKAGKPIVILCRQATEACKKHIVNEGIKKYAVLEHATDDKTAVTINGHREEYDGDFWELRNFIGTIWGK
jgi:hypothetical protein